MCTSTAESPRTPCTTKNLSGKNDWVNSCSCKMVSHFMKVIMILNFCITYTFLYCSMDVQGDYDPVDAAGFIKVNAIR